MRSLFFGLSLALCTPAILFAQETQDTANEAQTTTTIEDELSLGEPAENAEPQVGQTYVAEEIGDWQIQCVKSEDDNDLCQMYQLMVDAEDQPVAEISIFRLPEGGRAVAGATVIVPLETALQAQLTIQVDGGQARRYPYAFCNQIGCFARIGLVAEEIDLFRRGNSAQVSLVPVLAPDQTVNLTMSLTGFTASFDKTSVIQQ